MAYGLHWEWRGFGSVSPRFAKTYLVLPTFYETNTVIDEYLWIPGLEVNAKFRKGIESGLKFKRLKKQEGDFEIWLENENELYEFPLEPEAWQSLKTMLAEVDIQLPEYPSSPLDRDTTTELLTHAGCKIVTVEKERETRRLEQSGGSILIEWSTIKTPQPCSSIGLETWADDEGADMADEQALQMIKDTLPTLNVDVDLLHPMNYLEAVKSWANGNKI